jgi:hypothetical protein
MIGHYVAPTTTPEKAPRIVSSRCPGIARTQYRCTGCGCNVDPQTHKPGSEACDSARDERDASRWE